MYKISLQKKISYDRINVEGYDDMNSKSNGSKKVVQKKPKVAIEKNVPTKNYLYALLILIGGIVLALYIFEWINVKNEEKLMTSYLISSNTINSSIEDFNSLSQILKETSSSYFIYFGYTGDEDVYEFEKELKRVIDNYKLSDNFYYFDLTKIKEENQNYLNDIKKTLNIKSIEKVPAIIYVHNGKISDSSILDGVNGTMLKISDLENLLDIYEYELVK